MVREIDALQGAIVEVADGAGIYFRMLKRRKGPAVRGPRGQMDRDLYKMNMQGLLLGNDGRGLDKYGHLDVMDANVEDLLLEEGQGIETLAPLADPSEDIAKSNVDREAGCCKRQSHSLPRKPIRPIAKHASVA